MPYNRNWNKIAEMTDGHTVAKMAQNSIWCSSVYFLKLDNLYALECVLSDDCAPRSSNHTGHI